MERGREEERKAERKEESDSGAMKREIWQDILSSVEVANNSRVCRTTLIFGH